jgi:hypothetical protein
MEMGFRKTPGACTNFPHSWVGEFWKNQKCYPMRILSAYCILLHIYNSFVKKLGRNAKFKKNLPALAVSYKTKYILTLQSSNCVPRYSWKGTENLVRTKTCTEVFVEALFIIAKSWKQPKCPSVGEWINTLWYIQTMEYYPGTKRNVLSSHKETRKNLKCILLSERSQSAICMTLKYAMFWKR